MLTTNDEIWVFVQEESGNYVLWDEGTFRPMKNVYEIQIAIYKTIEIYYNYKNIHKGLKIT